MSKYIGESADFTDGVILVKYIIPLCLGGLFLGTSLLLLFLTLKKKTNKQTNKKIKKSIPVY